MSHRQFVSAGALAGHISGARPIVHAVVVGVETKVKHCEIVRV